MADGVKDEILKQAAAEMLTWLRTAGESIGEQAPLLANEIAKFGMAYHSVLAIAGLAVAVGTFFGGRALLRKINEADGYDKDINQMFTVCVMLTGGVGGFIMLVSNVVWALEAICAPRLYVLETVMGMLK